MIKINDRFSIKADERCFTVVEYIPVKDESAKSFGTVRESNLGYYTTVEQALIAISKTLFRESVNENDMTLTEAVAEFQRISTELKSYANGI